MINKIKKTAFKDISEMLVLQYKSYQSLRLKIGTVHNSTDIFTIVNFLMIILIQTVQELLTELMRI